MGKRKGLSQKTRFEVFKRDGFRCQYCGQCPPAVVLQVDHFVPVAEGGENDIDNLMTSCADCNQGKGAGDITAPPDTVAEKMRKQRDAAEQLREYNDFLMRLREEENLSILRLGVAWYDHINEEKGKYVFGDARVASVRTFLKQIPEAQIHDAMEIAFGKFPVYSRNYYDEKTWKYFCGICWKKIKGSGTDA